MTNQWIALLPHIQAACNVMALMAILAGYVSIRSGRQNLHRYEMILAVMLSALFLAAYLVYHWFVGRTVFAGSGWTRWLFFSILITHIIAAIALVPLLLVTLKHALQKRFELHRPLARKTLLIWLYVSITGLVVYGMGLL